MHCLDQSKRTVDPNKFNLAFYIWSEASQCYKCADISVSYVVFLILTVVENLLKLLSRADLDIKIDLWREF